MELPATYNPATRYAPDVDDPRFNAVQHELYGVLYDFNSHVKAEEKNYAKSGNLLRSVSLSHPSLRDRTNPRGL
jgi:hypothetical protein